MARDADNNKLHNEKTPQLIKDQRYDRFKQKRPFQTSWKEENHWDEASGRLRPKENICVFTVTCQKNRSGLIFIIIGKTGNSRSRFWNPVFHFRNFR